MTAIYGIGTPILFGIILFSHRDTLQTNEFTKSFGFLSTKMQSSFFWWEIFISLRKLFLVIATKFSDAYALPCALLNMFILISALMAQMWKMPFANAAPSASLTLLGMQLGDAQADMIYEPRTAYPISCMMISLGVRHAAALHFPVLHSM